MIKKTLKKGKNDIFYIRLGHINESYSKKIISIIDDIDNNLSKICFCGLYISLKIIENLSKKRISELITKLGKVNMDVWESSLNISLEKDCHIWTATNLLIRQIWIEFWPNKKELL